MTQDSGSGEVGGADGHAAGQDGRAGAATATVYDAADCTTGGDQQAGGYPSVGAGGCAG